MKIVEISGIKLEIDERTAKTVEFYKVGDRVRVLVKSYGDNYSIYPGIIAGFAAFANLPSIELLYLEQNSSDPLKFKTINAKSEGVEIVPMGEEELILDRADVLRRMDKSIHDKENDLLDLKAKREYFISRFAMQFKPDPEQVGV